MIESGGSWRATLKARVRRLLNRPVRLTVHRDSDGKPIYLSTPDGMVPWERDALERAWPTMQAGTEFMIWRDARITRAVLSDEKAG